eukprot:SAG11_NODE_4902_length_1729_cov_2.017791_2_plen_100_part_00
MILYPAMTQYTKDVAGWGVDGGKDQYGRPVILLLGWSPPTGLGAYYDLGARAAAAAAGEPDEPYPPPLSRLVEEWTGHEAKARAPLGLTVTFLQHPPLS